MSDEDRIAEILAEWRDQRERGGAPPPGEVVRAHPDLADALRRHFATQAMLDRLASRPGASDAFAPPPTLGEFRLLREIGRGGMGVVYEAEQTTMRRRVALKVLYPSVTSSPQGVERFQREARAAGRLHHTHVVPVYSMGEERGVWFYAMELVAGRSLDRVIDEVRDRAPGSRDLARPRVGAFDAGSPARAHYERIALAFAGVAEGLQAAHEAGVLHRDVKPSNLVLGDDGTLRLMDFGLARVADESAATRTGQILGTPAYMSPEQLTGAATTVDARADVYSLGATFYEVLTLREPFPGRALPDLIASIRAREPTAPRRLDPRIPRDLETIVHKAMEKEPARRYAAAGDMARDLRLFAEGGAIRARRVGLLGKGWRVVKRHRLAAGLAAAVLVLGLGVAFLTARAAREAAARRDLEYATLCREAESLTGRALGTAGGESPPPEFRAAAERLSRAIALEPGRIEAYFLRAMSPVPVEAALADLGEARARGLDERSWHLARACALSRARRTAEAEAEERAAAQAPAANPALDSYFRGWLAALRGRWEDADAALTKALDGLPAASLTRAVALHTRSRVRERRRDFWGAVEDLLRAGSGAETPSAGPTTRLASLWRHLQHPERAESLLDGLRERVRADGSAEAWSQFVDACTDADEEEWRDRAAQEAFEAHPGDPGVLQRQAFALCMQKRFAEALALLERAPTIDPKSHMTLEVRACALTGLSRFQEAIESLDAALPTRPTCATCQWRRAAALRGLGKSEEALRGLDRCIDLVPTMALAHSSRGEILAYALHRYDDAIAEFREALRLDPDRLVARENIGNCLLEKGEADAAAAHLREAIRFRSDFAAFHLRLGQAMEAQGDWKEAADEYERAIQLAARDVRVLAEAHHKLGCILANRRQDFDEAAKHFRTAMGLDAKHAIFPFNLAVSLQQKGDLAGAVEAYREALARDRGYVRALQNLGAVLVDLLHDVEAGIRVYEEWTRDQPGEPRAWHELGLARGKKGDWAGAVEAHGKAVDLQGDFLEARVHLGKALMKVGRLVEALAQLDAAAHLPGAPAGAWADLGEARQAASDPAGAIEAYGEAVRLDPKGQRGTCERLVRLLIKAGRVDDAVAAAREALAQEGAGEVASLRKLLGLALSAKGDPAAISELETAKRLDPADRSIRLSLGLAYIDAAQWDEAIENLNATLGRGANDAVAWLYLGNARYAKDERAKAVEAWTKAIEAKPDLGEAHRRLGAVLLGRGEIGAALDRLAEAARLLPKDAWAQYVYGLALEAISDRAGALTQYERALAIDPTLYDAEAALADILGRMARFEEALRHWRRAADLAAGDPARVKDVEDWTRDCESWRETDARREAIEKGAPPPKDRATLARYAEMWYRHGDNVTAARTMASALTAAPPAAPGPQDLDDLDNAGCMAALAGSGVGPEAARLEDSARAKWRNQADTWLRSALALVREQADAKEHGEEARRRLVRWRFDRDLAGVRDPAGLATLPEAERTAWTSFWGEVSALLARLAE